MSKINRRDFLKMLGAGATATALSGKLPLSLARAQGPIHLDFVVWSYSVETILDNIKLFEEEYNNAIKVTLTDFSWTAYHETMVNRFASKTPTDVCYNGGDWLPEFAKAGWVVPLEDYFPEAVNYKDKIVGYALKDMTYEGKLYGLPYYADITTFQYNAKILEDNGIKAPPETWEELWEQCLLLREKGMSVPIVLEFAQEMPTTLENFTAMVFGRGGELFDEEFNVLFNDPESAAWKQLKWLADAYSEGLVSLLPHETDVVKALNTGKHAFTVLYNYNLAELNNVATSPLAGQFKIALMPGDTHETYGFCKFYNMTKMAVDRGKEVMDACWKFIEYFGGEYNGEYKVAKRWAVEKGLGFGQLPLYDDKDVQASFAQWIDPTMLKEQATLARARNQTVWYGIWGEFFRIQLLRAVTGEATVEEAMKATAEKAEELKAQFA
ncbi:MAG: ABC transporter substrate-binding protein [Anaerolineae bacterium]